MRRGALFAPRRISTYHFRKLSGLDPSFSFLMVSLSPCRRVFSQHSQLARHFRGFLQRTL